MKQPSRNTGLYQAHLPYSCHGFVVGADGRIFEAAPIMRWAIGKLLAEYIGWVEQKKTADFASYVIRVSDG